MIQVIVEKDGQAEIKPARHLHVLERYIKEAFIDMEFSGKLRVMLKIDGLGTVELKDVNHG